MSTLASSMTNEDWLDTDFDLPDGEPIHASDVESDKEDGEEDWDVEMDFGWTGKKALREGLTRPVLKGMAGLQSSSSGQRPRTPTILPPQRMSSPGEDEEDDGVPTIRALALPAMPHPPPASSTSAEDFEDGFALPSDLTQLSLRPLELNHRPSKSSMEWGDRDHTSSSQSSDTYSTLGFADHSPPSTTYTSASLPDTEEEEEEDESESLLDGLVVPSGMFDSAQTAQKLSRILEKKKKTVFTDMRVKVASPDPDDDFESGLVLDDDTELSPSKLLQNAQQSNKRVLSHTVRSASVPAKAPAPASSRTRPLSRAKADRAKSPNVPPVSSMSQLLKLHAPPSPPGRSTVNSIQTYSQALTNAPSSSNSSTNFLAPKLTGLRGQKSHSGLKPASAHSSSRQLTRKASLPSLSDSGLAQASTSGSVPGYSASTASSRAKTHAHSTSRMHTLDYNVPPTRPTTPSANPAALRLTMPTSSSRLKSRTPISSVFPAPSSARSTSPLPPFPPPVPARPQSSSSRTRHVQSQSLPGVSAPKVLKRPKRQRTYGDGTELDGFEDLPLNREKEGLYRVQPKGHSNRVPGASYSISHKIDSILESGPSRRTRSESASTNDSSNRPTSSVPKSLKRTSRIDFACAHSTDVDSANRKSKGLTSPTGLGKRKPTLIRNLGGFNTAKVVGEMKWNPSTLRWEGNDQVLREFDAAVGTSTRPALITHLTGGAIGSPVNSFAAGARKVGNMIFDPSRMCWVSTLPPEEEEPDVFADLADDEDSDDWEEKGATIRASQQASSSNDNHAIRRTRSRSESESDRCSRASLVCDVDDDFLEKCRAAELRHRTEMRGWVTPPSSQPDRAFLFEIRALATRQY